jgi:hypothetical protein
MRTPRSSAPMVSNPASASVIVVTRVTVKTVVQSIPALVMTVMNTLFALQVDTVVTHANAKMVTLVTVDTVHSLTHATTVTVTPLAIATLRYANVRTDMLEMVLNVAFQMAVPAHVLKAPTVLMATVCVARTVMFTTLTVTDARIWTNVVPETTIVTNTPVVKISMAASVAPVAKGTLVMVLAAIKTTKTPDTNKAVTHTHPMMASQSQQRIQILMEPMSPSIHSLVQDNARLWDSIGKICPSCCTR